MKDLCMQNISVFLIASSTSKVLSSWSSSVGIRIPLIIEIGAREPKIMTEKFHWSGTKTLTIFLKAKKAYPTAPYPKP